MPRKRFSAFDDFPTDPSQPQDWQPGENPPETGPELAAQPASSLFPGRVLAQPDTPQVERIERLAPSQMMPDRFQPRRLLPTSLRPSFYSGQINCYTAARHWLQIARTDEGAKEEVDRLLAMGLSFEEHGQIKPITGSWMETGDGSYIFQIETGERRFWAACLQYVARGMKDEPLLRVEVITQPTRIRQVLENRHAEPPSAVGQACEIASLILSELGISPKGDEADEYDYFRLALNQQRMPNGFWEKLTSIMQLSRPRLIQFRDILDFPTPLLELADRRRVPERVLREIRGAPQQQWKPLLLDAIENKLTSDDVAGLSLKPRPQSRNEPIKSGQPDPIQQAINAVKRFADSMDRLDEDTQVSVLDELANDLVMKEQGESMQRLLRELGERIRIRQQNRTRRR